MSKKLMRDLVDRLNEATKYYDEGHPIMSDKEWDDLFFRLVILENTFGTTLEDSPTQKISYNVVNELKKVEHDHQMLSLDKTKSLESVKAFCNTIKTAAMLKLDGLTCSLRYENGVLVKAETRGNGLIGEDILHNAKVISSIPNYIAKKQTLVIDGEIICTYKDFEKFSDEYKNPRNFAAGSIRLLDSSECEKRNLRFVAWDVIEGYDARCTLSDSFNMLRSLGFEVVPHFIIDLTDKDDEYLQDIVNVLQEENQLKSQYPIDGVVFKYNDLVYGRSLGHTAHHFKNAIAYKFYDETYPTTLLDIEWTMGRTGVLTPVAKFESVDIDGSTIEYASLHNISIMEETLGETPHFNQKVEVFKANMIIPQIAAADKSIPDLQHPIFTYPEVCPICGQPTQVVAENESKVLKCTNPECEGKLINKLDHFCGKKGLEIKGLSKATLEKLINWGWVNGISDIMTLGRFRDEWISKLGFGVKSVDKILLAIENSKNTSLDKFITSLGIPLIGSTVSKELVKYVDSYEDFRHKAKTRFDFAIYDGFADSKTSAIWNYDFTEADKVYKHLNIQSNSVETKDNNISLNGITVVITGKLNSFKNRGEMQSAIESRGGKVVGAVSKNTKYLVNNDITSNSSKNKTAKELGVPIISEEEFIKNFLD